MAQADVVAQLPSGDDVPTWLVAAASVATTVVGWRLWGPVGTWLGKRLEADRQARALERGDLIAQLQEQIRLARVSESTRVEESIQLRQALAEETELRMTFVTDYAGVKAEVGFLRQAMADDKRDCQREIRRLNGEVRRLTVQIDELRSQQRGAP